MQNCASRANGRLRRHGNRVRKFRRSSYSTNSGSKGRHNYRRRRRDLRTQRKNEVSLREPHRTRSRTLEGSERIREERGWVLVKKGEISTHFFADELWQAESITGRTRGTQKQPATQRDSGTNQESSSRKHAQVRTDLRTATKVSRLLQNE